MHRGVRIFRSPSKRELINETLHALRGNSCRCPAHTPSLTPTCSSPQHRHLTSADSTCHTTDYAYEISTSNVRIGKGVTREVGMDLVNKGIKRVMLFTDKNLMQHLAFTATTKALKAENIQFDVFSEVRTEPTEASMKAAVQRAQEGEYEAFVAVGGGSVMDTAKVARLFDTYRDSDFLDFVNKPIGKGLPILRELKPLICIPTTSGTGSETTGIAIFDLTSMNAKTGFSGKSLCPTLGIVDPLNTLSMPKNVAIYSGLDVLCHAMESFTNIPYYTRSPLPVNPADRPLHQGSNPISDIWAVEALKLINKYFYRSIDAIEDIEAASQMSFASVLGGIGFGNAGVHMCHAISYALSGSVREYCPPGYSRNHPIIPHGLSVIVTAPAVFNEVGYVAPDRCIHLAGLLGANTSNVKSDDAGRCLSDHLRKLMNRLEIPDGLSALNFTTDDIPQLVEKTMPQERLTKLSPKTVNPSLLESIILKSMTIYN